MPHSVFEEGEPLQDDLFTFCVFPWTPRFRRFHQFGVPIPEVSVGDSDMLWVQLHFQADILPHLVPFLLVFEVGVLGVPHLRRILDPLDHCHLIPVTKPAGPLDWWCNCSSRCCHRGSHRCSHRRCSLRWCGRCSKCSICSRCRLPPSILCFLISGHLVLSVVALVVAMKSDAEIGMLALFMQGG